MVSFRDIADLNIISEHSVKSEGNFGVTSKFAIPDLNDSRLSEDDGAGADITSMTDNDVSARLEVQGQLGPQGAFDSLRHDVMVSESEGVESKRHKIGKSARKLAGKKRDLASARGLKKNNIPLHLEQAISETSLSDGISGAVDNS